MRGGDGVGGGDGKCGMDGSFIAVRASICNKGTSGRVGRSGQLFAGGGGGGKWVGEESKVCRWFGRRRWTISIGFGEAFVLLSMCPMGESRLGVVETGQLVTK